MTRWGVEGGAAGPGRVGWGWGWAPRSPHSGGASPALCPPWLPAGRAPEVPEEGSSCIVCDHLSHLGGTIRRERGTRAEAGLMPRRPWDEATEKLMATLTALVNQTHSASVSLLLLTIHPTPAAPRPTASPPTSLGRR